MSVPPTFRAWQYTTRNIPFYSNLSLNSIPQLKPPTSGISAKTPSILIKVHAVALNPVDYKVPTLPVVGWLLVSRPATPCLDFSGVIEHIPEGVTTDLKVGDRVFCRHDFLMQHGGLGEYTLAQLNGIAKLPDNVSFEQGAALGTAAMSALQPLEPYIKPGDSVFINGGSGGVGSYSIQIAKLLGAGHVTVTCSSANTEHVKRLGADEVIDYRSKDVVTELTRAAKDQGRIYDHIIENVGEINGIYEACHNFLKPGGKYVQVAAPDKRLLDMTFLVKRMLLPGFLGGGRRKYGIYLTEANPSQMQKLADWTAQGKLEVAIDSEYKFEDARDAFEKLASGRARGKIVVKVVE